MKVGKIGWSPDYEFIPDAFRKLVKGEITADVYVEDLKRRVERDKRRFGTAKDSNQEHIPASSPDPSGGRIIPDALLENNTLYPPSNQEHIPATEPEAS